MSKAAYALKTRSGQVVTCQVWRNFLFWRLVRYQVEVYQGSTYLYEKDLLKWVPSWRVFKVTNKDSQE